MFATISIAKKRGLKMVIEVLGAGIIIDKEIKAVKARGDIVEITTSTCKSRKRRARGHCPKKCPSELGCTKVTQLTRLWLKNLFGPSPPSFFTHDIEREILEAKTVEEVEAETIEERIERLKKKQIEELKR